MLKRTALVLLILIVSGCGRMPAQSDTAVHSPSPAAKSPSSQAVGFAAMQPRLHGFAGLPDRGELVAYPGPTARQSGAYTWYRADVSEAHALRAIEHRNLRVTTPAGKILDFRYDRHIEHPSGDWTWIGHLAGDEGQQTILTFGDNAAYGSIAQPDALPLRLTVRDGVSWLVQTDPGKLAGINDRRRPDYHIVPQSTLSHRDAGPQPAADGAQVGVGSESASSVAATTSGTTVVDLLVGYTSGFAAAQGGTSAALTRINYLVDVTNAAYVNSRIDAQVRLVKAMQVTYTDTNSNDIALKEVTGYDVDTQKWVTPAAAFNTLRAARETYGADLVALVRDFNTPENAGCGIAWLIGGGLGGVSDIQQSQAFGYSVLSDGVDMDETDNKNYYCLDETLAHELGHNMGAAHDKEASKGDDGVLDNPDDYGAYTYSFGYKISQGTVNFYTIMAYGDSGQSLYRTFSNPNTTFCGGNACGSSSEDNARTLNQTVSTVAGFRAGVVPATTVSVVYDFNGDGISDLLWRNVRTGDATIWLRADANVQQSVTAVTNPDWHMVGVGDFNADGRADVLWRNLATGVNTIWRSGDAGDMQPVATVANLDWEVVGVGDFDRDGRADIAWRNRATGANTIWRAANGSTQTRLVTIAELDWRIVGVGDFDGDGASDLLWRNRRTGANSIWKGGDYYNRQATAKVANLDWSIVGTGDFDADGIDDVLWRNGHTGANIIWRAANYATVMAMIKVANLDWRIEAVGDYTGDGNADVLWRNVRTGANVIWPSAQYARQVRLADLTDPGWQVQPENGP